MSEVTDVLDRLAAGTMTLDEAAGKFASRSWPRPPRASGTEGAESFPPDPEGSFAEVSAAYCAEQITPEQYTALAQAAARAMGGKTG